jgi:UDP-3-O-[3-hydroxymyristoyl] glucosamine N-acyltransferase
MGYWHEIIFVLHIYYFLGIKIYKVNMDSLDLSKLVSGKHLGKNRKIAFFGDILNISKDSSNTLYWVKENLVSKIDFQNFKGIIITDVFISGSITQIIVPNSRLYFSKAISIIFPELNNDYISGNVYVGDNLIIGKNVKFGQNVVIEADCVIGNNVIIEHNSVIKSKTIIGNNIEIGSLVTIGGSGFGYEKDAFGNYKKITHYGNVIIEDNVTIGNGVSIDRGTINSTKISENVKIDNQVHIAHNSNIGKNTIITAGVIISGSVNIGNNCWLGPNSVINNKASLPNNSTLGIGSVLLKKTIKEGTYFGVPAIKI